MAEQVFIQVRVDNDLKQSATDIFNELGLDMPSAIRMFLKRVVFERGLPFDVKLPRAQGDVESVANSGIGTPSVTFPMLPANNPLMQEYIDLLCLVPAGKLTRMEDIERFIAKRHGVENINITFATNYRNPLWEGIPLWREVSKIGWIQDARNCSRDRQEEMLRSEGHKIVPCGAHQRSLRVENYKELLVDFDTLLTEESEECADGQ